MFFFAWFLGLSVMKTNKQTNETKAEQYLFSRGADCYTAQNGRPFNESD